MTNTQLVSHFGGNRIKKNESINEDATEERDMAEKSEEIAVKRR